MHLLEAFNIEIGAGLGRSPARSGASPEGASSSPRLIVLLRGALEKRAGQTGPPGARVSPGALQNDRPVLMAPPARSSRAGLRLRTLPDVRPLKTSNPFDHASWSARIARRSPAAGSRAASSAGRLRRIRPTEARVLVAEDDAFWQPRDRHRTAPGIDRDRWARGKFSRGGSTHPAAGEDCICRRRKSAAQLRELLIARRLEAELKKRGSSSCI